MSRSLRIAHLPSMQPVVRFSGYLTNPSTDAQIASALAPFLLNIKMWRSGAALPRDWLVRDDSVLLDLPPGVTPVWGQGQDVAASDFIGDPETPWRLWVGSGQLVIENVWLYDARAEPWVPPTDCPTPPTGVAAPASPTAPSTGSVGAVVAIAAVATGAAVLWWQSLRASRGSPTRQPRPGRGLLAHRGRGHEGA